MIIDFYSLKFKIKSLQANVKAQRKKHSQIGERVGHRSAPFSLSHMFNDEIRFCVELVSKSYILPHLEGS